MDVNIPDVVAEVSTAFARYEQALVANDVATLDELFWDNPRTVRYGGTENLYGYGEIKAFRAARSPLGIITSRWRTRWDGRGRGRRSNQAFSILSSRAR